MRASGNLPLYSIILLFLATFTVAWPWPRWLPEKDSLVVRQDDGKETTISSAQKTQAPSKTDDSVSPSETGDSKATTAKNTNTKSGQPSATSTGTKKGASTSKKPTTTAFDARLPAGGVAMITPAIIDGPQYYKIGDFVTLAWNYTSLLATPTAVNIVATCTANSQLYTIAANQTVTNATAAVTWDTGAYQQTALGDPLLTEKYTLIIYDAAGEISATARAGYLAPFNQYTFGMYAKGSYVDREQGFICATCSGALGDMERRALGMVIGVSVLTVFSFTWFVSGTGIIW